MEHRNGAIARTVYEAFNTRDFDRGLDALAEDAVWTDLPAGETYHGRDEFRRSYEKWVTAFPDGKCEDIHVIAGEDYVVVEFIGRGTNNGPLQTPAGDMPPTGKKAEVPFCDIHRIEDGMITNGRSYYDMATMMRQLGLMPEVPAGATTS